MPLMKSKSPKAFEHNIKAEISAGKPQPQALAIAYAVKRKAKKKMAEGGSISASNEKRPMPDDRHDDAVMTAHNAARKELHSADWTGRPTVEQAQSNNGRKVMPIKRPKMVPSNSFSTRLYDKEGNLEESAKPGPYGEQPERDMNEEGPDRQGPKVSDMQDEHSTHRKPYAKGGEVQESDYKHPMNKYEQDLTHLTPSEDEGSEMARSHNEMDQDGHGDPVPDMEEPHNKEENKVYGYADGGEIGRSPDDSEMQPDHEEEEEHHDSIAAAIMAKKNRKELQMSDSDMDEMIHLYEGGEITRKSGKILSHDSIYSDDSDMADMSRNHDEDANEEDQLSFNALRKENYNDSNLRTSQPMDSNTHGDEEEKDSENKHDMISSIMRKMKSRQQFR
jgi:hypothetical protein